MDELIKALQDIGASGVQRDNSIVDLISKAIDEIHRMAGYIKSLQEQSKTQLNIIEGMLKLTDSNNSDIKDLFSRIESLEHFHITKDIH